MSGLTLYNGKKSQAFTMAEERVMRGRASNKDNAQECIHDMTREGWFFKSAIFDPVDSDVLELVFTRPAK